jgi:hypothetical protein
MVPMAIRTTGCKAKKLLAFDALFRVDTTFEAYVDMGARRELSCDGFATVVRTGKGAARCHLGARIRVLSSGHVDQVPEVGLKVLGSLWRC